MRSTAFVVGALPLMSGVFGWTTLNATLLEKIKDRMIEGATESWKAGTCAETLTEVYYPKVSVFNPEYLTSKSFSTYSAADLTPVLSIAKFAVESRSSKGMLWGPTGAAGDAGSLGVSVVLANHTQGAPVEPWAAAAETELELLLTGTPRLTFGHGAGAISHRPDLVSLWSDSVYMVPPFLAYYAAVTGNISLMREAHTQISLYRRVLYNQDASLWTHIYSPASSHYFNDTGFWCSGNGWAAAGMLRVLATMKNSPYSSQLIPEQNDLSNWITEIHTGMIKYLPFPSFNSSGGLFYNYVDQQVDSAISFPDASGTALFAASVYKHITLMNPPGYMVILAAAERARKTIYANDGEIHFDGDGWLRPVVNPDSFQMAGRNSDEAQSFVLQLDYNWKEWKQRGLR